MSAEADVEACEEDMAKYVNGVGRKEGWSRVSLTVLMTPSGEDEMEVGERHHEGLYKAIGDESPGKCRKKAAVVAEDAAK